MTTAAAAAAAAADDVLATNTKAGNLQLCAPADPPYCLLGPPGTGESVTTAAAGAGAGAGVLATNPKAPILPWATPAQGRPGGKDADKWPALAVGHGGDTAYCLLGPPGTGETVTTAAAAAAAGAALPETDPEAPILPCAPAAFARVPAAAAELPEAMCHGGDPPYCLLGPPGTGGTVTTAAAAAAAAARPAGRPKVTGGDPPYCLLGPPGTGTGKTVTTAAAAGAAAAVMATNPEAPILPCAPAAYARVPAAAAELPEAVGRGGDTPYCVLGPPGTVAAAAAVLATNTKAGAYTRSHFSST